MLLFARAARGALIPARLKADVNLASFAARADDGSLRVCPINKDARGARVRIDPGRRFAAASAMRLAAPSPDAAKGLRLGGASIDAFGRWAPAAPEMLQLHNGHVLVDVPGASAALVRLQSDKHFVPRSRRP